MKDIVSRSINMLLLSASLVVGAGIVLPAFPWSGLVFASVAMALAIWMSSRRSEPSVAQIIWDVEAEPVREIATAPVREIVRAPALRKPTSTF